MGGHSLLWPLSGKVIGWAIPLTAGVIWFSIRYDAAKFEKVPHDYKHKPWLYYHRNAKEDDSHH